MPGYNCWGLPIDFLPKERSNEHLTFWIFLPSVIGAAIRRPQHGFAITLPQARAPEENDENDIAAYDLYWNGSRDEDTQISARLIVNTRTDCASWLIKYRKELKLNPPVTLGDYSMTLDKPIKTHDRLPQVP